MLFLFKVFLSFFVSWPVIFFLSCSISIIFGFSHYALFSLDIISQFLFLSIYQSYRSKSLDWLTDKDVYIISWHTFVCLFHCHFVFLPIWVIFPPTHTQDAENIQVVFAFFCSQEYCRPEARQYTEYHRRTRLSEETAFDASHRTLLPCPPAVACESNSGPYRMVCVEGPAVPVPAPLRWVFRWTQTSWGVESLWHARRRGTRSLRLGGRLPVYHMNHSRLQGMVVMRFLFHRNI